MAKSELQYKGDDLGHERVEPGDLLAKRKNVDER
jgi:hypothetical protein